MRRLKKFALVATFFALLGALFVPTLAFAASHDGTGTQPSGGGGGGSWDWDKGEQLDWWITATKDGCLVYHSNADETTWNLEEEHPNYVLGAYMWGHGKLEHYDWITWDWLWPRTTATYYAESAGYNIAHNLPQYLVEQANEDGYYLGADPYQSGLWYNPSKGKYLDAVVRDEVAPVLVPWYTYQDKVVWEEDGAPGATTVNYDARNWSLQDKYQCAAYTLDYQHTTPPQNVTDSYVVDAKIQTIQQVEWYWVVNGKWSDYPARIEYNFVRETEYKKTINYNASTPDISPEYYCPLNVNRQGYAQVGDYGITSAYTSGYKTGDGPGSKWIPSQELKATVSNSQNKTNNAALETLDLNTDTNFTVTFNNDVLGLDASKNWNNAPPALAYGKRRIV